MKHVVRYSGGLASWAAAQRVVASCGEENVILLFADTKWEEPDTYRFLRESAANIGVELVTVCDGRTPPQIFIEQGYIGNSRIDVCSKALKRVPLDRWCKKFGEHVPVIGYDWTETGRFDRLKAFMPNAVAPLMQPPYIGKREMQAMCRKNGFEPPALYLKGFPHNNCGGACVKAGQAQWALVLKHYPERYAEMEEAELIVTKRRGFPCAILRDRRGGENTPLLLRDFRQRIASGDIDKHEWGGCGCATDYDELPGLYE